MGRQGTHPVTDERLLQADRLLIVGLVDRAADAYHVVLAGEPDNAQAIIGLANCEIERGNDRGAYDLAVRALRLDRGNGVARRMEERLAEVLATRGQLVARPSWVGRP